MSKHRITIEVNGESHTREVDARTLLVHFLREDLALTGTHIGCDTTSCGACTVTLDGRAVKSCTVFAVQADGSAVGTIEGMAAGGVLHPLQEGFWEKHGLQCGFCTPGMLIAARDIVRRLPDADERRIRVELSGNLCRCTGYLGIVNAVGSVIKAHASEAPVTAAAPVATPATPLPIFVPISKAAPTQAAPQAATEEARKGWTRFEESFVIVQPPSKVWEVFADIPLVAACLPGVELTEHDAYTAKGKMIVKLGPILAGFSGSAVIERDDQAKRGFIRGAGNDRGSGSRTKGEITYRLTPENEGNQTRVSLTVEYNLQGPLAQFSRSSLAQELGRRLVGEFAGNLNARLGGASATERDNAPLSVGRLVWVWLRGLFGR